ncbi:GNAT family N-acetyltransferase [Clostridium pasteurianum]|uniref:Acetyltransferase n=1 Tax=Clostridium pasteurianum BC1 TaxID=86416 RepID=R4K6H6_CLOPA|nr:GNAT family N-acetyltransferase [Clostridium pasteurianum]AGK96099.1 acetyltransferase [Clostridium pasteurianum BC1]
MNVIIEKFKEEDINSIKYIWNEVIDEGESFFWREHFSNSKISEILFNQRAVYCAKYNGKVIGFYILHDNFPGRGNHIANALYAITKEFRRKGIGKILGKHSIKVAQECGYKALQFNSIVSTNIASVNLWESLGFNRIGQVSSAFTRNNNEVVDIYIYFKTLY